MQLPLDVIYCFTPIDSFYHCILKNIWLTTSRIFYKIFHLISEYTKKEYEISYKLFIFQYFFNNFACKIIMRIDLCKKNHRVNKISKITLKFREHLHLT